MERSPYHPPTAALRPGNGAQDWPLFLALPVGFVAWRAYEFVNQSVLFSVLMDPFPLYGRAWTLALTLLAVAMLGLAAVLVGWRCRGHMAVKWGLLMAGAVVGVQSIYWESFHSHHILWSPKTLSRPPFLVAAAASLVVLAVVRGMRSRAYASGQ